jgi:two-component sensor histidine kinase
LRAAEFRIILLCDVRHAVEGETLMNLRGKTALILVITIVIAAVSVVLGSRWYFQRGLASVERADAEEALARAAALVADDLDQLDMVTHDWATWDDTWNYVESRDPAYVESNLTPAAIAPLNLSSIAIFDERGRRVYSSSADLEQAFAGSYAGTPPGAEGRRGVSVSKGALYLVCARAIQRSDGSGWFRGTLVMTRALNAARTGRYSKLSGIPVSIAIRQGEKGMGVTIDYSARTLRASMPIVVSSGLSSAEIRVDLPRIADRQKAEPLILFIAAVALTVVAIGMLATYVFEVALLRRMRLVSAQLGTIASTKENGLFVEESGADELGSLERSMNATLSALYRVIAERDIAMREIHHRVKNSLQVIASLISLQIIFESGDEAGKPLRAIERRVRAMAFVQEELLSDRGLERIDCGRLFRRIAEAAREDGQASGLISIAVDAEGRSVGLDGATAIGLIACEVISNSYRHAFPSGREGSIAVSMRASANGGTRIEIADDGIGLPEGPIRGLGSEIIDALAGQVRGTYRYGRLETGGTVFSLELPPEEGPVLRIEQARPTV